MSDDNINEQLVLISGESASGKSASLMGIRDQEKWLYLNCEAGKRLPFKNKFQSHTITDPYQVYEAFEHVQGKKEFRGIIVDTVTFLMDMLETQYVLGSSNTQAAWGEYAQFFKRLMQQHVAGSDKAVLILGHTRMDYDDKALMNRVSVPVKGSLKNNGIEAFEESALAA